MEAGKFSVVASDAEQLYLRWSERFDSVLNEQMVETIIRDHSQSVLRSPIQISEQTQVYLTGDSYMGNGIVRSCRKEGSAFILTITMVSETILSVPRQEFDPGILAVDNFLTEEEENRILANFQDDVQPTAGFPERVSTWLLMFSADVTQLLAIIQSVLRSIPQLLPTVVA